MQEKSLKKKIKKKTKQQNLNTGTALGASYTVLPIIQLQIKSLQTIYLFQSLS